MHTTSPLYPLYAAIEGFMQSLSKTNGELVALGIKLSVSIALMLIIWKTVIIALEGGGARKMIANGFYMLMLTSFAVTFINNVQPIGNVFIKSSDQVTNALVVTPYVSTEEGKTASLILTTFTPLLDASANIMAMESKGISVSDSLWQTLKKGGLGAVIVEAFSTLGLKLLGLILKIIAILGLMSAACMGIGYVFISLISVKIALLIAPIMIPFMIWDSASFIFDGWLKFLVKSIFLKVIGVTILATMGQGIANGVKAVEGSTIGMDMTAAAATTMTGAFVLVGLSFLTILLAKQIPVIAESLMSGMSRTGLTMSPPQRPTPSKKEEAKTEPKQETKPESTPTKGNSESSPALGFGGPSGPSGGGGLNTINANPSLGGGPPSPLVPGGRGGDSSGSMRTSPFSRPFNKADATDAKNVRDT